jgi:hypothetical protein
VTLAVMQVPTPWLGAQRGALADWVTQRWVRLTGRRVSLSQCPWLDGPWGGTQRIGRDFFEAYAAERGLHVEAGSLDAGLMPSFAGLRGPGFDPAHVHPLVARFYERTARYELELWSEWCGAFRPLGASLACLFSRRLQQLNVPLTPLASSRGMDSAVLPVSTGAGASPDFTAWIRATRLDAQVVYVAAYSLAAIPGSDDPCVKVVFPLPNGSASVFLRPSASADGALELASAGRRFGDPGFYFVVRDPPDHVFARHLPTFKESIRVFVDERGALRTDHVFSLWRQVFLRLHYLIRERS